MKMVDIDQHDTNLVKMVNKYNIEFCKKDLDITIHRLTNQLWKLIPMRENDED